MTHRPVPIPHLPGAPSAGAVRPAAREALLGLGFVPAPRPVETEEHRLGDGRWRITQAVESMGTVASITAIHASRVRLDDAFGRAWERLQATVDLLNRYEPASALGVLNDTGRLDHAPDELIAVVAAAERLAHDSGGAFDPTVGPLVDLVLARRATGSQDAPDANELRTARERVGIDKLGRAGRRIELQGDARLTLDGIAKGYVVDRVAAELDAHGIHDWLVNAGGDIRARGGRDGRVPWRIGVRDPGDETRHAQIVELGTGAVATSGDYEIHLGADREWHHLLQTSGRSARGCRSVTVSAPTAMLADGLATAAFVLGPGRSPALLAAAGATGLTITDRGVLPSPGWAHASEEERE